MGLEGTVCPYVGFLGRVNKEKYHRRVWKGGFTLTLLHTHAHTHTAQQPGMRSLHRHTLLDHPSPGTDYCWLPGKAR